MEKPMSDILGNETTKNKKVESKPAPKVEIKKAKTDGIKIGDIVHFITVENDTPIRHPAMVMAIKNEKSLILNVFQRGHIVYFAAVPHSETEEAGFWVYAK